MKTMADSGKGVAILSLPSGNLVARRGLCTLVQPCLRRPQHARGYRFFDATLLLVKSGQMIIDNGEESLALKDPLTLVAMAQNACADIQKIPGGEEQTFQSLLLAFAPEVMLEFHRRHADDLPTSPAIAHGRQMVLDVDLADTLNYCVRGICSSNISEREQMHRLVGLLLALAERGCHFSRPSTQHIADRLKRILADAPAHPWTTAKAGWELAMSEATLRRRLAAENLRFETLLLDIRMHHAMTLLQTTGWNLQHISEACGYRASARFSARFRERFGCSPSQVR
ncbi:MULTISPECIES: helix-turn-helix transcriptional regulator [unclassified Janthinobacterium]|uniref:helix-turn-helix transcriptional regulator n=1 Tax=unclassified Janthinobacterium TaxID=2610881 RepID=UPI00160A89BF|nr:MULTISPECIES: helix-turn-helix transcriptional regulator [unclassified Janthinobacterium]MBB5609094.1 AraC-like DNA-binding protein [Janthinobacterium sp. S3T4]MBB5614175.1 AraC-like DNA-binding protein [Janthinobacterium sp. S3M3]